MKNILVMKKMNRCESIIHTRPRTKPTVDKEPVSNRVDGAMARVRGCGRGSGDGDVGGGEFLALLGQGPLELVGVLVAAKGLGAVELALAVVAGEDFGGLGRALGRRGR